MPDLIEPSELGLATGRSELRASSFASSSVSRCSTMSSLGRFSGSLALVGKQRSQRRLNRGVSKAMLKDTRTAVSPIII